MSFQFLHEMLFTVETTFICTPYSHTRVRTYMLDVRHSLSFQSVRPTPAEFLRAAGQPTSTCSSLSSNPPFMTASKLLGRSHP